ncbi:unnamed protein product [Choristocarpus tenellus]
MLNSDTLLSSGGGSDRATFGVGGAVCDLDDCYTSCFAAHAEADANNINAADTTCASMGDLLAPSTDPAGANCSCSDEVNLTVRLRCLNEGCASRSQCYLTGDVISTVVLWNDQVDIVVYTSGIGFSFDAAAVESAVALWLNVDVSAVSSSF